MFRQKLSEIAVKNPTDWKNVSVNHVVDLRQVVDKNGQLILQNKVLYEEGGSVYRSDWLDVRQHEDEKNLIVGIILDINSNSKLSHKNMGLKFFECIFVRSFSNGMSLFEGDYRGVRSEVEASLKRAICDGEILAYDVKEKGDNNG